MTGSYLKQRQLLPFKNVPLKTTPQDFLWKKAALAQKGILPAKHLGPPAGDSESRADGGKCREFSVWAFVATNWRDESRSTHFFGCKIREPQIVFGMIWGAYIIVMDQGGGFRGSITNDKMGCHTSMINPTMLQVDPNLLPPKDKKEFPIDWWPENAKIPTWSRKEISDDE